MDVVSSLFNKLMGKLLFPDSHGACALLPKLNDELDELKHLQSRDSVHFPGSTMPCTPPERFIWMGKIHEDRPIGQIVWPATNKSATNKIGHSFTTRPFGQHQTLSIYYQLGNGVRALDIRVQQDSLVCNGNLLSYNIADVIIDIKKFLSETQYEIIVLEIQTERGYRDPPNFESYLVQQLGDLLINQDDHVFSKTISQLLPRRIICIWKPKNSPMPIAGGPIWSASYLRSDEFETELPLTKFRANLINLKQQSPASERNYFYKVEHILTPHASSTWERLLLWTRLAIYVSKRINDFARLFLANCNSQHILDRLQIYSTDFIRDDFIIACIALNYSMDIKVQCSQSEETIESSSWEYMKQAVKEENFMDEKVQMDLRIKSIFMDRESLTRKMEVATEKLEMMEKHSQDLALNFEKEQAVLKEKNRSLKMKLKSAEKDKEHLEMMMQKHRQESEQKVKNLEVQIEKMEQAVSWHRFVVANGICKQLCMRMFPQLSSVVRVTEAGSHTQETPDIGSSSEMEWESLKREHKVYAILARNVASSELCSCISTAISASTTDNPSRESISNTLDSDMGSYWSSKGNRDPASVETLVYKLVSSLCVVTEINIQPFQAYYQRKSPIYSSKSVRFKMGHRFDDISFVARLLCAGDRFGWTYTSPEFPMTQENCLQTFKLPEPVLCIGGMLQVELLGRVQRQDVDELFYTCISHVKAIGRNLSPTFSVKILKPCGNFLLQYCSEPVVNHTTPENLIWHGFQP